MVSKEKKRPPSRRLECEVVVEIQLEASRLGHRLFRNSTGIAQVRESGGGKRGFRYGLFKGSSDLIGWTKDGRFLAVECKSGSGVASRAQLRFIDAVNNAGGVAGVVRSAEDFRNLFRKKGVDPCQDGTISKG